MDKMTAEDIIEIYPEFKKEEAQQYLDFLKQFSPPPNAFDEKGNYIVESSDKAATILQPYIYLKFDIQELGKKIIVKDSKNEMIIRYKPKTAFGVMLFTSPKLIEGETYTVIAGDVTTTAVAKIDVVINTN